MTSCISTSASREKDEAARSWGVAAEAAADMFIERTKERREGRKLGSTVEEEGRGGRLHDEKHKTEEIKKQK